MVLNEGRDEVVAVVIAFVTAQGQRLFGLLARLLEYFRIQLLGQKTVVQTLIHQNTGGIRCAGLGHQGAGVVLFPSLAILTLVGTKGFFTPGAAGWRSNRRKGRHGAVLARMAQSQRQGTMAAHGMTKN